jgi:hypothetical protein
MTAAVTERPALKVADVIRQYGASSHRDGGHPHLLDACLPYSRPTTVE